MAGIKSRPISSLPPKDSLTSEARLPIIDKDDAGRLDNYSMAVATLATLARGPKGDPGERGIDGRQGAPGKQGNPGPAGPAGKDGVSVPRGGVTGQQLVKNSNADYDFSWKTSEGTGDMIASVYDPSTKAKEVAFKDETISSLNQKADKATTYTKSETYSKSEVDSKLKNVPSSAPSDAASTTKGIIRLSGDLGGSADTPTVPGLANKEPRITTGNTTQYWRGDKTWQNLNKVAVGLPNVDNTSDVNKPVSGPQRTALNAKEDTANKSVNDKLGHDDLLFPTQRAVKRYVDIFSPMHNIATAYAFTDHALASNNWAQLPTPLSVTADIGDSGMCLVILQSGQYNNAYPSMTSFAITGNSNVPASDANAIDSRQINFATTSMGIFPVTQLSPGRNVFTVMHKTIGGRANFFNRRITVIPL